jgi:hypothetical protein
VIAGAARGGRFAEQLPEPGRLWIRYTPLAWPAPPALWTQIAAAGLGGAGSDPELDPSPDAASLDDVLYLPPVPERSRAARDALARECAAAGVPVVAQLLPGEAPVPRAVSAYDLLGALLERRLEALDLLPPGAAAIWPLVAGATDDPELGRLGCARLAAAGVSHLVPLVLDLAPPVRRLLAERLREVGGNALGLFHAAPPGERPLARRAHAAGMRVFVPRPPLGAPPAAPRNRSAAEALGLAGELRLRLGQAGRGHALWRAAREADRTRYDLGALGRDDHLKLLPWLPAEGREIVAETVRDGSSRRVEELYAQYVAPERGRDE